MNNEENKNKIVQIFDKYYALMLHVAIKILQDRALAEDAVSESLEKIIKNISKIGEVSCYKTKSYIVIIVKNTSLNLLKKENRNRGDDDEYSNIIDMDSLIPEKFIRMEEFDSLVEIIKSLPPTLKNVAILSLVHEYSHREIAEHLGLKYDVVKMRLSRAKKMIKNILKEGGKHNE
ncbi:MAG: sigma-70 family RNA polymerase sigma factor [Defluviitaleaceae bacterium]|nr:sigma-70 family RNA polymerase sigma factor [Defluviitaleaceae bacterium]